ncbi:MAG TPA: hypothetical protein VGY57_04295 [Vicinamibacterales bacterium]|nr:hypothetical protein [Vicinamibacterales bacterium]
MAYAQSITTEAVVSAGYSTDDVSAAAVQLRAFGDLKGGIRYFGEAAWAESSAADDDVFAAAYPYGNRVQVIEAYGERIFRPHDALVSVRAGRFRTPFGIYSASDQGYVGFLRPPLVRYADYTSLSNADLEHGADFVVGVPRLTFEMALGAPADVGRTARGSGLDTVLHVQGAHGPFIGGVSYLRNHSYESSPDQSFRASAVGIDFRWMQRGVQVRGEWISGRPVFDATNKGWYVDSLIHLVGMGPVTAIGRIERLGIKDEDTEESTSYRQTIGARVRFFKALSLDVNLVHRAGKQLEEYRATALDVGLTWPIRW